MALRLSRLRALPDAFLPLTGLTVGEFDALAADLLPESTAGERPGSAGRPVHLCPADQLLLVTIRARHHLPQEALGTLFGVSDTTALRVIDRWLPALAQAGYGGRAKPAVASSRTTLASLLGGVPELVALTGVEAGADARPSRRAG